MKTHITTLNNMAGTASLAHRRVLKVAQSIGCHEMGLSFYPLKPDYAKEIDKRLDGIIAPLNYGDIVIFQYPSWIGVNYDESFVNKIKSYRDTKLIIFVQDIQKLMFDSEQAILDMEIKTLNKADLLILPSKKMHRYLKENGLDEKPVIYQTIWDMPSDICFVDHAVTRCFHFAGNYNRFPFLAEYHGKTPIYQYDANKPDRENDDSFCWRGYFEQEKLMHELSKGGFGLVWSDDEYFDRYYSMNQPYKLGTNLAAGIPVIVKRGCVHEKFVERNGLGYAVDTLDEADKLVQSITDAEYIKLCSNTGFMNRKELNMSKNINNNQTVDEKKGKRTGLTILGYVLVIVALLIVLPVVLPPIFGYHTYLSGTDHTGNISKNGSVVYLKTIDEASYKDGNIVAIESADSSGRRVDSYYVDSNDSSAKEIALRDGNGVSYKVVKGQVIAKTPFIGYLSQLCFSAVGIIVTVVIFAAGVAIMMYVNKISKEINTMVEQQTA